jgi:queuosine precursor transporter
MSETNYSTRQTILLVLAGFFVTNAIVAELISCKLVTVFGYTQIIGILPWPFVFICTDTINEYYGQKMVKRLSFITAGLIAYTFILVSISIQIPSSGLVSDDVYTQVFGQSQWVMIGSLTAFLIGQLIDAAVFAKIKKITNKKHLWARATFSTVISQLFDSFIVLWIGFYLPGKIQSVGSFFEIGFNGYVFKLVVALLLIPVIYCVHAILDKKIGTTENL